MRKPGGKNANRIPSRGQKVSVVAQQILNLVNFLFHHRWRCNLDWKITGVSEDTVFLLAGQRRLDQDKDPNVLPKVNKISMAETMKAIKEYLRSCHGVVRAPFAYIVRKTVIVQTYGNYSHLVTPDDEMITRMLHLPTDKNMFHHERSAQSIKEHTAEYKKNNRSVYDILDQICKDINLYPFIEQQKS